MRKTDIPDETRKMLKERYNLILPPNGEPLIKSDGREEARQILISQMIENRKIKRGFHVHSLPTRLLLRRKIRC